MKSDNFNTWYRLTLENRNGVGVAHAPGCRTQKPYDRQILNSARSLVLDLEEMPLIVDADASHFETTIVGDIQISLLLG